MSYTASRGLSYGIGLYRLGHINPFAHFPRLLPLGFAERRCRDGKVADARNRSRC
jgi:hypothetical protein